MAFFRGLSKETPEVEVTTTGIDATPGAVLTEGSLEFTIAQGGNGSLPSYQEASGAPVEIDSPLGYFVGPVTIVFLNISMMVGTGVYSTREPPAELDHLISFSLTSFRSCYHPQGHWLRWFGLAVLAAGLSRFPHFPDGLPGVRRLLSESIWRRSRLPRASISTSRIPCPRRFCGSDRHIVL